MYIPKGGVTLENEPIEQIRMGIQGFYGTGKTIAASTFPNPVYMDIDRGLGALSGRSDIIKLKFYDNDFCKQINPNHKGFNTLRDTVLMFLDKEAKKLEADQTLVVDGSTGLQNAYHAWYDENPVVTKTGSIDDRAVWRLKLNFFGDICETLKTLRCNVLYIAHEYEKPDSSGEYNGKIRPLMSGQFCNQLGSHFNIWVRQLTASKPKEDKIDDKLCAKWGKTKSEFIQMLSMWPRDTMYFWKLDSDDTFDGKISSLKSFPSFIPATYQSLKALLETK